MEGPSEQLQEARDRGCEQRLSLCDSAKLLIEECRMVLPGVQALFGFQLVAVFNTEFSKKLSQGEQDLHLLAIGFVVMTIGLLMAPATYHRQTTPEAIFRVSLRLWTRLLLFAMFPLTLGLCLDFYLVMRAVTHAPIVIGVAIAMGLYLLTLWFVLPRLPGRPREEL
jgi:hypothetical protein